MIGALMPSVGVGGSFGVQIGINGTTPQFGFSAANYGTPAGQEVVAFGLASLNVGDTVALFNIGAPTSIGGAIGNQPDGPAARLTIYKIADL
ncbi:hypothetical protein MHB50_08355 [Siminovitchia sp. FSL H7-0308]